MLQPFEFNEDLAVETILYIANRVNAPTFHRISKIMYFADKMHLEKYGRFICGDNYVAMKHGPVPSGAYDILKAVRFNGYPHIKDEAREAFEVINYTVIPNRDADLDQFSDSDIECLDYAIKEYGTRTFNELTNLSHDEAWKTTGENEFIEIEQIAATFADPSDLLEHLNDPYPG
jgi:uncharacterized phage-associated protein